VKSRISAKSTLICLRSPFNSGSLPSRTITSRDLARQIAGEGLLDGFSLAQPADIEFIACAISTNSTAPRGSAVVSRHLPKRLQQAIEGHIDYLRKQLKLLDDNIDRAVHGSKLCRAKHELLRSVPGVGPVLSRLQRFKTEPVYRGKNEPPPAGCSLVFSEILTV
jgi:hypothetical protein